MNIVADIADPMTPAHVLLLKAQAGSIITLKVPESGRPEETELYLVTDDKNLVSLRTGHHATIADKGRDVYPVAGDLRVRGFHYMGGVV